MTPMRRGWFRPSPGMQRISDATAKALERAADAYYARMAEFEASYPQPAMMAQACSQCGERNAGKSGLCRECWHVRQIDRAIAADAPCRCGAKKSPLAMHCDACLVGRDKGVDYGDSE